MGQLCSEETEDFRKALIRLKGPRSDKNDEDLEDADRLNIDRTSQGRAIGDSTNWSYIRKDVNYIYNIYPVMVEIKKRERALLARFVSRLAVPPLYIHVESTQPRHTTIEDKQPSQSKVCFVA